MRLGERGTKCVCVRLTVLCVLPCVCVVCVCVCVHGECVLVCVRVHVCVHMLKCFPGVD